MATIMKILLGVSVFIGASVFAAGQTVTSVKPAKTPFSLTIGTDTPEVKTGSTPLIRIRLTNISGHVISASAMYSYSNRYDQGVDISYEQEICDSDGNVLKNRQSGEEPAITGHTVLRMLKPGESINDVTAVNGRYDLRRPGRYTIQLSRPISDKKEDGVVKSNKLTITVTP